MIVIVCQHPRRKPHGMTKSGTTRYRCCDCRKTFTESTSELAGMRIGMDRAAKILTMLCEGASVSATARIMETDPHTILDLLVMVGERCETYMASEIQGVHAADVQVDELWQFIFCKRKTAERVGYVGGCGDSYCFTAVERNTKLLLTWHLGERTEKDTNTFCRKLKWATTGRFQLTSDGFNAYPAAVGWNLGNRVDYGVLIKSFAPAAPDADRIYSPPQIIGAKRKKVFGAPVEEFICTSHAERLNGSIRNFVKRMGRLTYCFSKRWGNHRAALGLFFAHYNFCRRHRTLKGKTPAMATGLATKVWTMADLLEKVLHT
ncbi:MAG: hypothetical protein K8T25_07255 [Planctomycetia bacterium]|nr:hypothetical protein [Planctomycetia bacterium]